MRYIIAIGYYVVMTGWIYWVDAGHGDSWWSAAPVLLVQLGVGYTIARWWAPVLPVALPFIALPAGYPDSPYGEPLPLWFGIAFAAALAIPLVLLGVVGRKVIDGVRRGRPRPARFQQT